MQTTQQNLRISFLLNSLFTFTLLLYFFSKNLSFCQEGYNDTTFEANLYQRFGSGLKTNGTVYSSAILPDGKILIGGSFSNYNGISSGPLVRLNADGSLDTTYHPQHFQDVILAIALLDDEKLLVSGEGPYAVVKLLPNGELDTSFQLNTITGFVKTLTVQNDQKIILGGQVTHVNGIPQNDITRLFPNGEIDTTFDINGGSSSSADYINTIILQTDNKILIGGSFTYFAGVPSNNLVRLYNDGSRDFTFDIGSGTNNPVLSIAVQNSGKIIATGDFNQFNGTNKHGLICLLQDGSIDPDFSTGVGAPNIQKVMLKENGDIILGGGIAGYDSQSANSLIIIDSTGTFLSTVPFGLVGGFYTMSLQPDGKIIVGGSLSIHFDNIETYGITRILPNCDLDSTFVPWTGAGGGVLDIALLPDGKMLIGGYFDTYDGHRVNKLARLNTDGTLDLTFNTGTGANDPIQAIAVQTDGKILLVGTFTTFNGIVQNRITRLNSDGSLDLSFNTGTGFATGSIFQIDIQQDGKLLIGGNFSNFNGNQCNGIIRLNQDGTIDSSFDTGTGSMGTITAMALQTDGKIIVTSHYYNGVSLGDNPTLRLNPDGSLDTSYNPNTSFYIEINTIAIQADNKILIGGGGAGNSGGIIRLNSDGTQDFTFNTGTGVNYDIYDILPLSNGQIILAGDFYHYNSTGTSGLIRVNNNGTLDPTFHTPYTPLISPDFRVVKCTSTGNLLVGGFFTSYNFKPAHLIASIYQNIPATTDLQLSFVDINPVLCDTNGSITALAISGTPPFTYEWQNTPIVPSPDIHPEEAGIYTIVVTDSLGRTTQRSILLSGYESVETDLSTYLTSEEFRPGFLTNILIQPVNRGCTPANAQLKFILPELLSYDSAIPEPSSISEDTLIWDFSQLVYDPNPNLISISVSTSTNAEIGDSINLQTIITPVAGDYFPQDNLKNYVLPIVNGYDPNNLTVYPQGKCDNHFIENDQELTYTIRFQNTGNSEAINIYLLDTLSPFLDINTVRVIGHSHDVRTELVQGNILRFNFDNIHLADSINNESESHGQIIFSVRPLPNQDMGTIINNQAGIYFDWNPVITTNSVSNSIFSGDLEIHHCNTGVSDNIENEVRVFPNPSNGSFVIQRSTETSCTITLTDFQGKIVIPSFTTSENMIVLKMDELQKGIYLLNLHTGISEKIVKLVKE